MAHGIKIIKLHGLISRAVLCVVVSCVLLVFVLVALFHFILGFIHVYTVYCPNQANCKQNGVKANCKQSGGKVNCKHAAEKANHKQVYFVSFCFVVSSFRHTISTLALVFNIIFPCCHFVF